MKILAIILWGKEKIDLVLFPKEFNQMKKAIYDALNMYANDVRASIEIKEARLTSRRRQYEALVKYVSSISQEYDLIIFIAHTKGVCFIPEEGLHGTNAIFIQLSLSPCKLPQKACSVKIINKEEKQYGNLAHASHYKYTSQQIYEALKSIKPCIY